MGELTNRVSNDPDSYFDSKAVALEGCGDCPLCLITCGRGLGRNGRVGHFQLNSQDIKKAEWENSQTE